MKLFLIHILFVLILRADATDLCSETVTLKEALTVLENILHDDERIREFFHNKVIQEGNNKYCGKPSNCADLFYAGFKNSGVYTIHFQPWMKTKAVKVYCDMETDGGGWIVFQRRKEIPEMQINFTRSWLDYKTGFGDVHGEFWLGNEYLHILTLQDNVEFRVDLEDFDNNHRYAVYNTFQIGNSDTDYQIHVAEYSGTAGNGINMGLTKFVTYDQNDVHECAKKFRGGWWYTNCHAANLNGLYLRGEHKTYANGINWHPWLGHHYSLKWTEMKIRPKGFK